MASVSHGRWLFLILLVALLLRLPAAGVKSLWLDEAYSAYQAEREELATPVFVERPHPPLYYTLLHHWVRLAGDGEMALRLPSAAASVAGIGVLYLLARTLTSRQAALLAAALLALSPLDQWYAQEARMHIFVTLFGLLYALALAWKHPLAVPIAAAALGIGLYVDYAMLPLWAGLSAMWFAFWWRSSPRVLPLVGWLAGSLGGWLLYRGWWTQLRQSLDGAIGNVFVFAQIREWLGLPRLGATHFAIALSIGVLAITGGALAGARLLSQHRWRRTLTVAVFLVFAFVSGLMLAPRLFTVKRVLVTGWPYVLLLMAWLVVMAGEWRRWLLPLVLGISLITSLGVLVQPKDDWRAATAHVERQVLPRAIIWLDPSWNELPYRYYARRTSPESGTVEELAAAAARSAEIWLVAERLPRSSVPSSPAEAWLDENWSLVHWQPFYRLEVRAYRPR